jgi:glycosyltransferase involved in cell wall biosynthesis
LIAGDGPSLKGLKAMAGKTITFLGHLPADQLKSYLSKARAFVFSAEEDFGIVNVEAQASGIPVIAYGRGGALETVIQDKTGLFFYRQDVESLIVAIQEFLKKEALFSAKEIRANAERFPRSRFEREFKAFVDEAWNKFPYK